MRIVAVLLALLVLVAADCTGDGSPPEVAGQATAADLPDWLREVYPPPGAELAANQEIQVDHEVLPAGQRLHLLIDGTDVSTAAEYQQTTLIYNPSRGQEIIELEPGLHTATVQLVEEPPPDGDVRPVLDQYEWTFNVL